MFLSHPAQFVLSDGAGIHEGLSDDGQDSVHVVGCLDIKDELRVLHNVDPEAQRQTGSGREHNTVTITSTGFRNIANSLPLPTIIPVFVQANIEFRFNETYSICTSLFESRNILLLIQTLTCSCSKIAHNRH